MTTVKKSGLYGPEHQGVNSIWLRQRRIRDAVDEILFWHNAFRPDWDKVTVEDVFGRARHHKYVLPRADLMRRLRGKFRWSYPRIAALFGRDHTTVMHHCEQPVVVGRTTQRFYHAWLTGHFEIARARGDTHATDLATFELELEWRRERRRAVNDARKKLQAEQRRLSELSKRDVETAEMKRELYDAAE